MIADDVIYPRPVMTAKLDDSVAFGKYKLLLFFISAILGSLYLLIKGLI